jgi:2-phosphosulfolactate phosphatase
MKLDIVISPALLPAEFEGEICAVIDVLRATTTIVAAMAGGAAEVRPCLNAHAARQEAKALKTGFLLGGEEKGLRIPGFDLGNSPLEYAGSRAVDGKAILFATTNGTPALSKAYQGSHLPVFIAAIVNVSTVAAAMVALTARIMPAGIRLVCAGRYGQPSKEDIFSAGLMGRKVMDGLHKAGIACEISDAASIAMQFYEVNKTRTLDVLAGSEHGRYLQQIGFVADIEFASQIDRYNIVPIFDGTRIIRSQQ